MPFLNPQSYRQAAKSALNDPQLRRNLGKATTVIREKRLGVVAELPDWQALRDSGAAIKANAMQRLPELLLQLESSVIQAGGQVHWAADDSEANAIVVAIAKQHGFNTAIKVKSITTNEIGLNDALAANGIAATETDLAELIVQLAQDHPSHILVPAIHKNRAEIRTLFLQHLGLEADQLSDEPAALAAAARHYLRQRFLSVPLAISGANFAIAATGTVGVVESEGNGRMCLTLPKVLVTIMGIEKVLPELRDLEVMLQLLPRSSTAEHMNPYTSLWTGVHQDDGPQQFHLILLDNGRSKVLADRVGRQEAV
jgi:L-lactate dehydrogenase complex protein LldF